MRNAIIFILLVLPGVVAADQCRLSEAQASVFYFSYSYGEKHNYGYTLAAIAMAESDLGRWVINLDDPSGSNWHVTVDKAVDKMGWSHTPFNYNRAIQLLVDDVRLGAEIAVDTINYWHKYHKGDWMLVWGSYNGGFRGNPEYAKKIKSNIEKIKRCGWLNNEEKDMF